jgi:hypothetical protein
MMEYLVKSQPGQARMLLTEIEPVAQVEQIFATFLQLPIDNCTHR